MKYLFFDIECANCFNKQGKIYSFGYVTADENLNVIDKEKDIVINPNVKEWDWYVIKNILAYPKSEVEKTATFEKRYSKIKKLLEDENTVVCGFSVKDDVGYVLDECKRYNLEPIKINFFDIQRIDAKLLKSKNRSLFEAYVRWCQKLPEGAHRSDVDARFTLEVAKAICQSTQKTLAELISETPNCAGSTDGLKYGFNNEELESRQDREERKAKEKLGKVKSGGKNKFREVKPSEEDFMLKGTKNNLLFLRLLDSVTPIEEKPQTLKGEKVSISLNYEFYNFKNMMKIVQLVCDHGGEYVKKASNSTIFVKYHLVIDGEERRCSKYDYVKEQIELGNDIKVMEFDEFLELVGVTEIELNNIQPKDYEYLLDDKYKK